MVVGHERSTHSQNAAPKRPFVHTGSTWRYARREAEKLVNSMSRFPKRAWRVVKQSWLSLTNNERLLQIRVERLEAFRASREKALLSTESRLQEDALNILHLFHEYQQSSQKTEDTLQSRLEIEKTARVRAEHASRELTEEIAEMRREIIRLEKKLSTNGQTKYPGESASSSSSSAAPTEPRTPLNHNIPKGLVGINDNNLNIAIEGTTIVDVVIPEEEEEDEDDDDEAASEKDEMEGVALSHGNIHIIDEKDVELETHASDEEAETEEEETRKEEEEDDDDDDAVVDTNKVELNVAELLKKRLAEEIQQHEEHIIQEQYHSAKKKIHHSEALQDTGNDDDEEEEEEEEKQNSVPHQKASPASSFSSSKSQEGKKKKGSAPSSDSNSSGRRKSFSRFGSPVPSSPIMASTPRLTPPESPENSENETEKSPPKSAKVGRPRRSSVGAAQTPRRSSARLSGTPIQFAEGLTTSTRRMTRSSLKGKR